MSIYTGETKGAFSAARHKYHDDFVGLLKVTRTANSTAVSNCLPCVCACVCDPAALD